jgi:hypothetical protein
LLSGVSRAWPNQNDGSITAYTNINVDGSLRPLAALSLSISGLAPAPSISPGAVFAANSGSGDISAFTTSTSTGALSPAAGSPVTGLTANSFAATDLEGNFLFTGSAAGTQIGGFSVTPSSGTVAALTGSPLTVT